MAQPERRAISRSASIAAWSALALLLATPEPRSRVDAILNYLPETKAKKPRKFKGSKAAKKANRR